MANFIAVYLDLKNKTDDTLPNYVLNLDAVGKNGFHTDFNMCGKDKTKTCILCDYMNTHLSGIRGIDFELYDMKHLIPSNFKFYDGMDSRIDCQENCDDENCILKKKYISLSGCKIYNIRNKELHVYTNINYVDKEKE